MSNRGGILTSTVIFWIKITILSILFLVYVYVYNLHQAKKLKQYLDQHDYLGAIQYTKWLIKTSWRNQFHYELTLNILFQYGDLQMLNDFIETIPSNRKYKPNIEFCSHSFSILLAYLNNKTIEDQLQQYQLLSLSRVKRYNHVIELMRGLQALVNEEIDEAQQTFNQIKQNSKLDSFKYVISLLLYRCYDHSKDKESKQQLINEMKCYQVSNPLKQLLPGGEAHD